MSMHFENPTTPAPGAIPTVCGAPTAMEEQQSNPPCVVGMACRVPGASSPSQLWDNILKKVDLQRKMPEDRFNVDAFYHPDGTHKGTTNAKYGYFLDQDLGRFDAGFFNISGKEAEAMDPQQRLLLEVVYEALEDAGITLDEIQGSLTSVYCGCFTNDYNAMTTKDLEYYPKYTVTGTGNSILANRISYFYNLHGPSATVDTACSSSLVCFHLGAQSLRNAEADISIVVGSALHFDPNIFITMTDLGMLSTDGRCRHGDAAGSGYVRGEGIAAMILKRQSRAQADGDSIRAVVRGTGVNHDGRKQGITLPSAQAQADLIQSTYRRAGLEPADTTYVECHGTGTKAGDPRELKAIHEVFTRDRPDTLYVGSVKTNIGHLEGASGVAGLIKATMALEKKIIPPNMHFSTPNPEVDFKGWKLEIPTEAKLWNRKGGDIPRRVSINSFGYGGTNAHVILEEYTSSSSSSSNPPPPDPSLPLELAGMVEHRPYLVPLTSHSERAGKLWAQRLATYLADNDTRVADVALSLSSRRTMHRFRSFAVSADMGQLMERIQDPLPGAGWKSRLDTVPRIGFVFTGQGAQWFGMGRSLIEQCPLFLQSLQKCDRILQALPSHRPTWSVVAELQKSQQDTMLAQTEYSQPICTAVQLALIDVLAQWGIKPAGVVGHSSGELGATYAAGLLSFENALVAAYYRGVHMGSGAAAPGSVPGAMMAVGLTEAEVTAELEPYSGRIAIAAMNSPSSFTVSGDEDAVVELQQTLTERKVFARRLQVAQAFHSHHMFPLAPGYKEALAAYPGFQANKQPSAIMVSSVTGRYADPATLGPDYLAANMTGMVKFSDALTEMVLDEEDQQRIDVLVEVGPHPALKGPSNQTLDQLKLKLPYLATLDRKQDAFESLLATAGQLFALGYPVDLEEVNRDQFLDTTGRVVSIERPEGRLALPSYAWDHHDRYWAETRPIREHRLRASRHGLLGARVPGSLEARPRWRNYLRVSEIPWLPDHSIDGKTIFPAAGYINMAVEAAATMVDGSIREFELVDVSVKSALVVSDKDMGTETIVELAPAVESAETSSSMWKQFVVLSVDEAGNQREHCTGLIRVESGAPGAIRNPSSSSSVDSIRQQSFRSTDRMQYYRRLHSMGLQYGATFQLVTGSVESGDGVATAPVSWNPSLYSREETDMSIVHPALLDACFHPVFAAVEGKLGHNLSAPYVPTFIRSLRVSGLLDAWKRSETSFEAEVVVETKALGPRTATNDIRLHSSDGQLLLDIQGLKLTSLGSSAADDTKRSLFFGTQWKPMFTGLQWAPEQDYPLARLVELYLHQHPNSKILHVTSSVASTERILPALKGIADSERRNIVHLVILPVDGAAPGDFDALVDRGNGLVSVVESSEDTFDLVVSTDIELPAIPKRVAENGFLVALNSTKTLLDTHDFQLLYNSSDLQVWHNKQSPVTSSTDALTLVMPVQPTPDTRELAELIKSQRQGPTFQCDFLSLIQCSNDLRGDVVVLASLDSNLYFDPAFSRAEEFQAAQALLAREGHGNIVWLTRGGLMDVSSPEQALILGLARSARSENPELRLVVFDIAPSSDISQTAKLTSSLLDASIEENEIAERGGLLHIPRVVASDDLNSRIPNGVRSEPTIQPLYQQGRPLALRIGRPGLLDTLMFADDTELTGRSIQPDELEIEVKASALNFRDIAASMGIIDDFKLGDECAGVVLRVGTNVSPTDFAVGDRVVAWRPGQGAHRTILRNPACLCYRLQGEMPFAVAASIPLVLTTAYYSLVDTARLQRGETILIHSAAGGVGQMAIQIAQNIGATIIATVGSAEKRTFLIEKYGLEDSHILSSRDDSFVEGIRRLTNGRGVDVVLNSLAGPLLLATWASVAPFGRFVEIGKRDIHQNSRIPMDPFRRNVSFASVDMITVFERNQPLGARVFQESCALVHGGEIQPPQPLTEVPYADVQRAFRMLQTGTTSGKIVLTPGPDDRVLVEPPRFRRRPLFCADRTYLLVGGLGGLGRRLSEWLFQRGARHLAFLSRSGKSRPEARETVEWLEARGVDVKVFSCDATDSTAVNDAVAQIETSGNPLAGVFQAAMVLQDAPLSQMSFSQWQRCLAPKVRGAYNLHNATAPLRLDFFVCFSSVSAILGSKGQANYSAANNYLDALCAYRRSIGLVGTTMDVGMVVGVGAVSEDAQLQTVMERIGYDAVNEEELFAQIDAAVCPVDTQDKLALVDSQGRDAHQIITGVNLRRPTYYWATEPRFRNLYANHDFAGSSEGKNKKQDVMAQLQEAPDEAARVSILTLRFLEKIAAVLSVDQSTLQPNRSLGDYGLDSIVAIEIRQWFFKAVGVELAMFDILSSRSIQALIEKVASVMVLKSEAEPTAAAGKADVQNNPKPSANNNGTADSTRSLLPAIKNASTGDMAADVPMSSYQRRLWFMHNVAEDPSFLNLPTVFRLRGQPDTALVRRALEELKRRNKILRTAYSEGDEFSLQRVMDDCTTELPEVDFSSMDGDAEASLDAYVKTLRQEPMDIEDGAVMKTALVKLSADRHALVLIFHHICIDRGSSQSFLEQFTGLYDALRRERNLASVGQPAVSYGEFSIWHNALLQSSEMQPSLAFWKSVYEDQPASAMRLLPFAKAARPEINDYQRHVHRTTLKKTLLQRMKRICARLRVTPAQFLMAGLRAFLYRYTEEEDLTIHLVDGNRPHPAVNDTLGFFVNVVPVRCQVDHSGSFEAVLRQIKDLVIAALQHAELPFDAIVDAVGAARTATHFPLGQVILNYQVHGTMPVYSAGDFDITEVQGEDIPTACEIGLEALEDPAEGLKLRLEYSRTLYGEDDMARFLENFVVFLSSSIHDYRQPVAEVNMVGSKELTFLKDNMFNLDFVPNTWENMPVAEHILAVARAYPHEVAVESSEGADDSLTYASLVAQASDIAQAIIGAGVQPASKVGILSRPGPTAVAAMVGALFAGCGYVTLDPDFAKERLAFMIADSSATLVLAEDRLEDSARALSPAPVLATGRIPRSEKLIDSPVPTDGDFPFYTIYTSGSTGTPKGVVLSQSNTQQMLSTLHHDYRFNSTDRFLHHSSISFDLSIVQIFSALTAGARVCVASAETRKDPLALATYMQTAQVSVTYFTPTHFALLIESAGHILEKMSSYRVAYFAGERLPVRVAKAFYDLKTPARLYNTWSPSELVVQTTIQSVDYPADDTVNIPIGFPMANTRHYILDSNAKPLPMGVVGEIVVGGAQVGLGYINRPEINDRAFLPDPFCSEEDHRRGWGRMFRTGDRGRFLPGGNLEFHGRIAGDKQVKLRGYRVDLGEVEHRIFVEANEEPAGEVALVDLAVIARQATVETSQDSGTDDRQLIAFVVPRQPLPRERQSAVAFQLNQMAAKYLNPYMLPNAYQFMERLPTTIGGKVDLQKLLKCPLTPVFPVEDNNAILMQSATGEESPGQDGAVLDAVIQGFRQILKLPATRAVGPDDSFFALGGHSLLLMRLQARLKRGLKLPLPLNAMFKNPTPAAITQLMISSSSSSSSSSTAPVSQTSNTDSIDWEVETRLAEELKPSPVNITPSQIHSVLLTGVDSFIGLHMLATLLEDPSIDNIYVLGSQTQPQATDVFKALDHYHLSALLPGREDLEPRIHFVPGDLVSPRFGLSAAEFRQLGRNIQAIYHLGGYVSLLRSYDSLRESNVTPVHDIIHLASLGRTNTRIHHLSTWSVPHLQTWSTTSHQQEPASTTITATEVSASHFTPEPSDRLGYFKSRWVAEMLMEKAAARGFAVTIYRASAATADRRTGIPEPKDDFIRTMILSMIQAAAIPRLPARERPFVVDFVPVDYITRGLHALAMREAPANDATKEASIYHLSNPQPLPIEELSAVVEKISAGGQRGRSLPVDEWFEAVAQLDPAPEAQVRWAALKEYFDVGHLMFGLETAKTRAVLQTLGMGNCEAVGVEYLKRMLGQS